MKDTVFDQVIFSIAIVYSRSLFEEIQGLDQHILISVVATIIALVSTQQHNKWNTQTEKLFKKTEEKSMWRKIVSQWLKILRMISTFIAIHNLVDIVNQTILQTERFYYEAFLFPVITIMFSIGAVTVFDNHFFSK